MSKVVAAYKSVTASDEFKELERIRAKARHDEAQAIYNAEQQRDEHWQVIVAVKETALAEKETALAKKDEHWQGVVAEHDEHWQGVVAENDEHWQGVVAEKDTALAEKDSALAQQAMIIAQFQEIINKKND